MRAMARAKNKIRLGGLPRCGLLGRKCGARFRRKRRDSSIARCLCPRTLAMSTINIKMLLYLSTIALF